MATEWLRNAHAALGAFVVGAMLCSLVLTLTRRRWSPTEPRARVGRALIIVAVMGLAAWLAAVGGGAETFWFALLPSFGGIFTYSGARLLALGLAALFFGMLIPVVIEGRTLREMGWLGHRAGLYAAAALLVGVVFRLVVHPPAAGESLLGELDGSSLQMESYLRLLPMLFVGASMAEGLVVAFVEENVFRGHLMLSLRESGWRGAKANHLQAVVFAAYHPYLVLLWSQAAQRDKLPGLYLGLYLFGLLFGYLRWRTGSIVPGFVSHAVGNAVFLIVVFGPMAGFLGSL